MEFFKCSNGRIMRPRFDLSLVRVRISTEALYKIGCASEQKLAVQVWEEKGNGFWARIYDANTEHLIGEIKLEGGFE